MDAQLTELLPFLHDRNPQVRQIALSNLVGHTAKGSPNRGVFFGGLQGGGLPKASEDSCIRDLKLLCRDQPAIAHDAFRALVNLSDSPLLSAPLSEPAFLIFLVSYIVYPPAVLADLAAMLLSNITLQASACAALLAMKIPIVPLASAMPPLYPPQSRSATAPPPSPYPTGEAREVGALPVLVQAFVQGAAATSEASSSTQGRKGSLHFLANVFANISTVPTGRVFFLTPRPVDVLQTDSSEPLEFPLAQLIIFTEHADLIRRGGVASTIKNCAFDNTLHKALLANENELVSVPHSSSSAPGVGVVPYVLLPLAGPEEFDLDDIEKLHPALQFLPATKKRETDEVIRRTHVETLLLLCVTLEGRGRLRTQGVYEIVRTMHLSEEVDTIAELIERLVNLLKRDEELSARQNGRIEEANTDTIAAEVLNQDLHQSGAATLSDDDEDYKIEEI